MRSILVSLLLTISSNILACSCEKISRINNNAIINAKDIFLGTVVRIEANDEWSRKITFRITERLKTDSITQISIITGLGGTDCGLNIHVGEQWYIFAHGNGGKSWAGLCGRSALLSKHSIQQNSNGKKYFKRAVRQYAENKARAKREIMFIRKNGHEQF